jgi:hypothetical protein
MPVQGLEFPPSTLRPLPFPRRCGGEPKLQTLALEPYSSLAMAVCGSRSVRRRAGRVGRSEKVGLAAGPSRCQDRGSALARLQSVTTRWCASTSAEGRVRSNFNVWSRHVLGARSRRTAINIVGYGNAVTGRETALVTKVCCDASLILFNSPSVPVPQHAGIRRDMVSSAALP